MASEVAKAMAAAHSYARISVAATQYKQHYREITLTFYLFKYFNIVVKYLVFDELIFMFVYHYIIKVEYMNSLLIWSRSFLSWVLAVDTPPYPYESWRDLPKEQWPKGYDPIIDAVLPVGTTRWTTDIKSCATTPVAAVQPEAAPGTAVTKASSRAANRLRKQVTREPGDHQVFVHR